MSLQLPHCESCARAHWPSREICPHCLGHTIVWRQADGGGRLVTATMLHHSLAPEFRDHLPLQVATVQLDCGTRALVYLAGGQLAIGSRVTVSSGTGPTGKDVLVATPAPR